MGPLTILALATAPGSSAQETTPPASAPAATDPVARDVAADVERLLEAQKARIPQVEMNALDKEWPRAVMLDACTALLRDRVDELTDPQRYDVLRQLTAARAEARGRSADQDRALADVLAPCLADAMQRRACLDVVPLLAAEARPGLVPAVIATLDEPDWIAVTEACRVLRRLGPEGREALPRLRDILAQPDVLPAAAAPPPKEQGLPFGRAEDQARSRGIARLEAATARMWITGDAAIDAPLFAELDPEGRQQLWSAAAMAALKSSGGFDGNEAHAAELSALLLEQLERTGVPADQHDDLSWPVLGLLAGDGVAEPARSRARALIEKLSSSGDAAVASCADKLVHPPETICRVDQAPPADPRQTLLFAPRSRLSGAVPTAAGVVALSSSMRGDMFESYTKPPSVSVTLHLWDARDGREIRRLEGLSFSGALITFSRSGARLFAGPLPDPDGTASIAVVNVADGTLRQVPLAGNRPDFRAPAFVGEALVATTTRDGRVEVWDLEAAREVAQLALEGAQVNCLAASADGRHLLAGCGDGRLLLLGFEDGTLRQERVVLEPIPAPERAVLARKIWPKAPDYPFPTALAVLPGGTAALCADNFGDLVLRDLADGAVLRELPPTPSSVSSLCVSSDGALALAGCRGVWTNGRLSDPLDFTVQLLDLRSGTEVTRFTGMQSNVARVAFVEDESGVKGALGSSDFAVRVWNLQSPAGR
jgi:hypothetical protein